jgi:hypothetical protein
MEARQLAGESQALMRSKPMMVAISGVVILLQVSLLRSPASGQDVPSIGSNDGTNFGIALPLRGVILCGEV